MLIIGVVLFCYVGLGTVRISIFPRKTSAYNIFFSVSELVPMSLTVFNFHSFHESRTAVKVNVDVDVNVGSPLTSTFTSLQGHIYDYIKIRVV